MSGLQSIAAFREALGWGNDASQPPQAAFAIHEPVSSAEMDWPSSPTIDMPTQPRASRTTMISGALFALALVLGIAGYMKVQRQTGQAASVATPVVPASNEPSANRP